jgi:hypothetical protein
MPNFSPENAQILELIDKTCWPAQVGDEGRVPGANKALRKHKMTGRVVEGLKSLDYTLMADTTEGTKALIAWGQERRDGRPDVSAALERVLLERAEFCLKCPLYRGIDNPEGVCVGLSVTKEVPPSGPMIVDERPNMPTINN